MARNINAKGCGCQQGLSRVSDKVDAGFQLKTRVGKKLVSDKVGAGFQLKTRLGKRACLCKRITH